MISHLFAQFIKEKRYIANLSERTIHSYQNHVFKRWMKYVGEIPTASNLTQFVIKMREDPYQYRASESFASLHHPPEIL